MIDVRKLISINDDELKSFGFNGFKTDKIYDVKKLKNKDSHQFIIDVVKLQETYTNEWSCNPKSEKVFNEAIKLGLSFGAYEKGTLLGYVIVNELTWNNSLWIENIRVSEKHKGKNIGSRLIDELVRIAEEKEIRIIGLEVHSSNYPAIEFYKKNQFEINGIDLLRYPKRENSKREVAIIMTRTI